MKVIIRNFKSIDHAELELALLTLLIGPPASGKSNILDAIALAGYFGRFSVLDKEYENIGSELEPLTHIARFQNPSQLFRHYDITRKIIIDIEWEKRTTYSVYYEKGQPRVSINGVNIPWNLITLPSDSMQGVRNALSQALGDNIIEARLYGYDRYGLTSQSCQSRTLCGFNQRLANKNVVSTPKHVLSELGWNAPLMVRNAPDLITELNESIAEHLEQKIEVKVLRSGAVTIFDYDIEVDTFSVSDSIFRALYYLTAIRTASNYAKLHGLENRLIILLEEPEAHLFPYFFNLLVDQVVRATEVARVAMATHNPILVSMLWDKVKEVKTHYVTRDNRGSTKITEIDVDKMARDLRTAEELLYMSPSEVLDNYGKREPRESKVWVVDSLSSS